MYKLDKPFTDIERADFICLYQGLIPYEDNNALYMFADNNELQNSSIVGSNTKTQNIELQNSTKKVQLQAQINSLDLKRVRALAEGGTMSDGTTYLEYYTNQIIELRDELNLFDSNN